MKATCPNDPTHKRFMTTVHVMYDAMVDDAGNILELVEQLDVCHGPDTRNIWNCVECDARATAEYDHG